MMNPAYHFARMRELIDEFEPGRARSLAATKLDECELWLTRCQPAKAALERDMAAPAKAEHAIDPAHRAAYEPHMRPAAPSVDDDPFGCGAQA